jgi:hypothetical protein
MERFSSPPSECQDDLISTRCHHVQNARSIGVTALRLACAALGPLQRCDDSAGQLVHGPWCEDEHAIQALTLDADATDCAHHFESRSSKLVAIPYRASVTGWKCPRDPANRTDPMMYRTCVPAARLNHCKRRADSVPCAAPHQHACATAVATLCSSASDN